MSETNDGHMQDFPQAPTPMTKRPRKPPLTRLQRTARWFVVVTAIMLGTVAVATAWSGYQAAKWQGMQFSDLALANVLRVESTRASTKAGQDMLHDLDLVNQWINAYTQGNSKLANIYESRFRPQFLPIFKAWLALNPFHNPNAPGGPLLMPQYNLVMDQQANQLQAASDKAISDGQAAEQHSKEYVRNTVILATVLFLTAVAWNFSRQATRR